MRGVRSRRWHALVMALLLTAAASEARAQPDDPAREAGRLSAEAREVEATDALRAAHLHEKADQLDPQPYRLAAAIEAATRALEPTLAMRLVERATGRPGSPALEAAVAAAKEKFGQAVGYLTVRCGACAVTIDAKPGLAGGRNVVPAGSHIVEATEGEFVHRWPLSLGSGEVRELVPRWLLPKQSATSGPLPPQLALAPMGGEVTPSRRSPALRREPDDFGKLTPGWFWGGVAVTGAATMVTVASGIDAIRKHDRVDQSKDFFDSVAARRADYRTGIFGAVAAGCALGTTAIGVFAVDFGGSKKTDVEVTAAILGPSVELGGSF